MQVQNKNKYLNQTMQVRVQSANEVNVFLSKIQIRQVKEYETSLARRSYVRL